MIRLPWARLPRRISLASASAIGLGSAAAIIAFANFLIGYIGADLNTRDLLRDRARLTVEIIEDQIRGQLDPARAQSEYLAALMTRRLVDPASRDQMVATLRAALAATPQLAGIAFIGPDFRVTRVNRDGASRHEDWSDRPEVVASLRAAEDAGGPQWQPPVWSTPFQEPILLLYHPVLQGDRLLGFLAPAIRLRTLSEALAQFSGETERNLFILYGTDRVIADPSGSADQVASRPDDPLPRLDEIADPILKRIWSPERQPLLVDSFPGGKGHVIVHEGQAHVFLYSELAGFGAKPWLLGTYLSGAQAGWEAERLRILAAVGAGTVLLAALGAVLLARRVSRPISVLAQAARAIRSLDLSSTPPLGGSRIQELDEAADAFNAMAAGLRQFEMYVPRKLVTDLVQSRASPVQSEERLVTVMFTDIAGFSDVAARLSPVEAATLLNHHFGLIGRCIEAEAGTIDKFTGDGVMAFWGAPADQPDHAARACRAARAIAEALRADNATRAAAGEMPIRLRIGLHTGPALVGNIGFPGRINYTLVGDTVNVAERVQDLGKQEPAPGDVVALATAQTALLAGDKEVASLGTKPLRGRTDAFEVVRLI